MKTVLIASIFFLCNITFNWLPSGNLLIVMMICVGIDFITGVIKAKFKNKATTSEGYRKTIVKLTQYLGVICISVLLSYLSEKDNGLINLKQYTTYINDGLLVFITFIELTSILENIYAIDNTTMVSRYFIKPLLKLFTFQIKNNPITRRR